MRTKKYWGQHFLTDHNIARKIVASIPSDTPWILEVGPGKGMLTQHLLSLKKDPVKVVEIDNEAVAYLNRTLKNPNLEIIRDDFLKIGLDGLFQKPFTLVGNFPYNISSQIFFKIIQNRHLIQYVIGMVQREVAERISSQPGSRTYGILSVLLQTFFRIEFLFKVSPNVFDPPPAVQSAVIRLTRNERIDLPCDESLFFTVVKSAFNQRRKILKNSLKSFFVNLPEDSTPLQKRPEQLHHDEFIELTSLIEKQLQNGRISISK